MYKIAIVEDDENFSNQLKEFLKKILVEKGIIYEINSYLNPDDFFRFFNKQYDLIFSDIDMPKMNGYEACKKIREVDNDVTIVFVTQLTQFAIKGYEVNAVDYILKPLNFEAFNLKIDRILYHIKKKNSGSFIISLSSSEKVTIKYSELIYISSDDHFLEFGTEKEIYNSFGTLKKYEESLNQNFYRCHSSYIINLAFVMKLDKNCVIMKNNKEIPISRNRRKEFVQHLQDYYLRGEK